jgi:hypothetical protein
MKIITTKLKQQTFKNKKRRNRGLICIIPLGNPWVGRKI